MTPKPMTEQEMIDMFHRDCLRLFQDLATPAWLGESNVEEVQDLIYDEHANVIDVSKMEPVWIVTRVVPAETVGGEDAGCAWGGGVR